MGEIENRVASNGDLNPTYVRNMERMANAVENPFADMEESDIDYGSDPSEVVDPSPVPPVSLIQSLPVLMTWEPC